MNTFGFVASIFFFKTHSGFRIIIKVRFEIQFLAINCVLKRNLPDFEIEKTDSRMRSEGFPFIVWGSGGWTLVRLEWLVASSSDRRRVVVGRRGVVNSVSMWKLQTLCFSKVSKQVVMSFCVAGMALCDSPTCLITCRKFQNWRTSRTKCSFCCAHVSCLESLVF